MTDLWVPDAVYIKLASFHVCLLSSYSAIKMCEPSWHSRDPFGDRDALSLPRQEYTGYHAVIMPWLEIVVQSFKSIFLRVLLVFLSPQFIFKFFLWQKH